MNRTADPLGEIRARDAAAVPLCTYRHPDGSVSATFSAEQEDRRTLLRLLDRARGDRFAMLDVLAELVACDGRECDLDATGECRPHGYPTTEAGVPCPYQRARDMLAAAAPELDRRRQQRAAEARGQLERMLDDAGRMRRR